MQGALVGLIDQHHGIACKIWFCQKLAKQHTIGHVLHNCLVRRTILKTNTVSDLVANLDSHLLRNTRRHRHCCNTSRLRAPNLTLGRVAGLVQILGQLRGLPRPGLADDHHHRVLLDLLKQLVSVSVDRQRPTVILQRLGLFHQVLLGPRITLVSRDIVVMLVIRCLLILRRAVHLHLYEFDAVFQKHCEFLSGDLLVFRSVFGLPARGLLLFQHLLLALIPLLLLVPLLQH
mmetsp:Transcript_29865/g.76712  ORF Transcript_29865/g.76712 Transcript_29865/m.76712 type:complete len:232 (+) Transcript_29865:1716-2411(+)